jgi:hypothetical protein
MKTIKIVAELRYDDKIMHGNDKESKDWFYNDILKSKRKNDLILHSKEIGDEIGTMKITSIY